MDTIERMAFVSNRRYPSCHASTITELPNGDLLAAWYAGAYEKARDVAILCSRLPKGSSEWTEAEVLAKDPEGSEGNPVLFVDPKGILWLFYVTMYGGGWDECKVKCKKSLDDGRTWGETQILRDELGWMTRNKPIITKSGSIILPIYDEAGCNSMMMISKDGGDTWRVSGHILSDPGNLQPAVVELKNGTLLAYLRTWAKEGGCVWRSVSEDGGYTWSQAQATKFPNPNSAVDMIRCRSRNMILAFNDTFRGRTPLSLALSQDGGASWPFRRVLERGPGEFSYPAIIQSKDGLLHITYTYKREAIKHVVVSEEGLTGVGE
jgi:predicted neuraminidase